MLYLSRGFGLAGKRVKQTITLNPGRFRPHHRYPKYNKIKTIKKHSKYKLQEQKEMKRQQVSMRRNENQMRRRLKGRGSEDESWSNSEWSSRDRSDLQGS